MLTVYKKNENFISDSKLNLLQKRYVVDLLLSKYDIKDVPIKEHKHFYDFAVTAFPLIYKDNDLEYQKYRQPFIDFLSLTHNKQYVTDFIFNVIYNKNIYLCTDEKFTYSMFAEISPFINSNSNIEKLDFFDIVDCGRPNLELIYNPNFLNSVLSLPKLDTNISMEYYQSLLIRINMEDHDNSNYSLIDFSKNLKTLEKFSGKKHLSYDYVPKEDSFVLNLSYNEGFRKIHLGHTCDYNFHEILPFVPLMNDCEFKKLFSNPICDFNRMHNSVDINYFLNHIIERAEKNKIFENITDLNIASNNFHCLVKAYTKEELFDNNQFSRLLNLFKKDLNELTYSSHLSLFLYESRNQDLAKFGFRYDNPEILKNIIELSGTAFLDDLKGQINNSKYRYPNGNNVLHDHITKLNFKDVCELVHAYPHLTKEINNIKKMPIDLVVGKINIMSKKNSKYKDYVKMFKLLIKHELSDDLNVLSKFKQKCDNSKGKISEICPELSMIIVEKLLQIEMNNTVVNKDVWASKNNWKL